MPPFTKHDASAPKPKCIVKCHSIDETEHGITFFKLWNDARHISRHQAKLDWLRLIRSENVGPRTFRTLINHYGGAARALAALPDLARRGGAGRAVRVATREDAERELAAAEHLGVAFIAIGEAAYPAQLQTIDDAPPLIAVRGKTAVLNAAIVAIVGSRNASAAGVKVTERPRLRLSARARTAA